MKNTQLNHQQHQPKLIRNPVCLLLNDFESPANVGSIFRIADAFGIEKIYLTGITPVPPNRKMMRTSRATEKFVSYQYSERAVETINDLKSQDYKIISLEITSSSRDIRTLSLSSEDKVCLILGAENEGVNSQLLALSDETIHIPMLGENSSINVAVAGAIAVFEIIS
ncbi:MAG: TrmH family RNA methyltransferase [Methylophaga sp.]|nr:TrmH family RNA methyltransferase [Methylophaga sp.]